MSKASKLIDAVLAGKAVTRALSEAMNPRSFHNSYAWHDGHTKQNRLTEADEVHKTNDQAAAGKVSTFPHIAKDYGTIRPGSTPNIKFYPYKPEHAQAIDNLVKQHGFQSYYAGGKYGQPDLAHRNYDTGHLQIWDPDEGSGGDFGERSYTDSWRKLHELSHALTLPALNAKYGEARRMGKLGHQRTPHEAMRSVEWEHMAATKQRELSSAIGVHISDSDHARESNTVASDAVHRAITGIFSNPSEEGFNASDKYVPLSHSLGLIQQHADRMGLRRHDTFKKRGPV